MAVVLIILSIIVFTVGFLTPISGLFTLAISIALLIRGIFLLIKKREIKR